MCLAKQLFELVLSIPRHVHANPMPSLGQLAANVQDGKHVAGLIDANHCDGELILLGRWQSILIPRVV